MASIGALIGARIGAFRKLSIYYCAGFFLHFWCEHTAITHVEGIRSTTQNLEKAKNVTKKRTYCFMSSTILVSASAWLGAVSGLERAFVVSWGVLGWVISNFSLFLLVTSGPQFCWLAGRDLHLKKEMQLTRLRNYNWPSSSFHGRPLKEVCDSADIHTKKFNQHFREDVTPII